MNSPIQRASIAVGGRLPDLALPAMRDGALTRVAREGRLATVLAMLHGGDCVPCARYLDSLAAEIDELRDWDARVLVVLPPADAHEARLPRRLEPSVQVLLDPGGALAERLGLEGAALVIADQWGEVFLVRTAGAEHELPALEEIVQWAHFLAIQCPECQGEAR